MEWMATITGDRVGFPGFWDFRDFSPRRKILGSKKLRIFRRQIFAVELANVFCFKKKCLGQISCQLLLPGGSISLKL